MFQGHLMCDVIHTLAQNVGGAAHNFCPIVSRCRAPDLEGFFRYRDGAIQILRRGKGNLTYRLSS